MFHVEVNVDDRERWNIDCSPDISLSNLSGSIYNMKEFYETEGDDQEQRQD
jgi:hypothetical protein